MNKNYTKILKDINKFEAAKKANERKPIDPYKYIMEGFLSQLTKDLSRVELKYNEENKVSSKETITGITDKELAAAVGIAGTVSRSKLLSGKKATDRPEYASLTPLLMYAHKKYNSVAYEAWDKSDPYIKYALGSFLVPIIDTNFPKTLTTDEVIYVRQLYLGDNKATAYAGRLTELEKDDKVLRFLGSKADAKILLQTWLANSEVRVPGAMILDLHNWDQVPKAYDITLSKPEEAVTDDLPWNNL